jgi:hypothetical protein
VIWLSSRRSRILRICSNLRRRLLRPPLQQSRHHRHEIHRALHRRDLPQTQRVPQQRLLARAQLKPRQEAKANLQPRQLRRTHAPNPRDARVRVAQVLQRLHGDAQPGEQQAVAVAARDGDGALLDG